jgi:hypothetical protein
MTQRQSYRGRYGPSEQQNKYALNKNSGHGDFSAKRLDHGSTMSNMSGKPTSMIGPCQEAKRPPDALGGAQV